MKDYNPIAAVTGANSGLGKVVVDALRIADIPVLEINGPDHEDGYDLTRDDQIVDAAQHISDHTQSHFNYRILINCAGINYIEWFESLEWDKYEKMMRLNVRAPIELAQFLIGPKPDVVDHPNWFEPGGAILNIVSNASHVPMTNSVGYNASKGALHIATLSMARELRKTHGINVFGISPNKLKGTGMSAYIEDRVPGLRGWTPEEAARYQLSALPAGEETDPEELANFIAYLFSSHGRHKYLTNTIIPYGA